MKTKTCVTIAAIAMLLVVSACAEEGSETQKKAVALESEVDKVSYAMGAQTGRSFKARGIEINVDAYLRGIEDSLAGREPALSQDEMTQVMGDYRQRMMAERQEQLKKEAEGNLAEGQAFLEENKTKEGVKVLASGLQYKVLTEGTGRTPTENDRVKTHYTGTLIDGAEFDSSYKRNRPAEFPVTGVIKGWQEALQLMKEGAKWQVFIPPELAYGERGRRPTIPPSATLIFEMELIEIVEEQATGDTEKPSS